MLHSASLTDPAMAYPHFSAYHSHHPLRSPPELMNGHQPRSTCVAATSSSVSTTSSQASSAAAVLAALNAAAAYAGIPTNVKDSRWLTLEVCRQFQRNQCSRDENECKFAHPPTHVDVQNGRVVCCYDSIKGKCQRRDPPCKYLHPPQHLREQLIMNGRNNMILRNMQVQLFQQQLLAQSAGILPAAMQSSQPTAPMQNGHSNHHHSNPNNANSIMYPGPAPLALTNPFMSVAYSPYLSALPSSANGVCCVSSACPLETADAQQTAANKRGGPDLKQTKQSEQEAASAQCVVVLNESGKEPATTANGDFAALYGLQPNTAILNVHPQAHPHFSAIADPTGYFQPAYHFELQPYAYH